MYLFVQFCLRAIPGFEKCFFGVRSNTRSCSCASFTLGRGWNCCPLAEMLFLIPPVMGFDDHFAEGALTERGMSFFLSFLKAFPSQRWFPGSILLKIHPALQCTEGAEPLEKKKQSGKSASWVLLPGLRSPAWPFWLYFQWDIPWLCDFLLFCGTDRSNRSCGVEPRC